MNLFTAIPPVKKRFPKMIKDKMLEPLQKIVANASSEARP